MKLHEFQLSDLRVALQEAKLMGYDVSYVEGKTQSAGDFVCIWDTPTNSTIPSITVPWRLRQAAKDMLRDMGLRL